MESLMLGLSTTLIGITVVFVGLIILIVFITLMNKIQLMSDKKQKNNAQNQVTETPAPVEEDVAEAYTDDEAIIAALSAAISAVWENENTGFVVRRVRRINTSPAWQVSARDEQLYSRM